MTMLDVGTLRFDSSGLIPAIVQDAADGRVLMLGYMNAAALAATEQTGEVHFWSRSRDELWHKGATSGNRLRWVSIATDCDADALLIAAEPTGPTCHTGTQTCFGNETDGYRSLTRLWRTIAARKAERPEGSYTAVLLDGGVDACARKVLEEAGEVAFAAKDHAATTGSSARLVEESADLLYHLMVLLAERTVGFDLVVEELDRRSR